MQYFNHTASLMEAAILKNMPETRSEDSMLFRKISRFVLSKWPVQRFCKKTAFPKAHWVKNADHEFTRQNHRFCFISCAFHFEWWSHGFLLYLGTMTSQAYPYLEAYPILEYPSKYRYVLKNGRFDQFPWLNLLCTSRAHRIRGNTNSCQHAIIPVRWLWPLWHTIRRKWHLWFLPRQLRRHPSITITPQSLDSKL